MLKISHLRMKADLESYLGIGIENGEKYWN